MQIKNYEKFINFLTEDLSRMFEKQKEHICCKAGCSLCCERGNFPFSEIEFAYLKSGMEKLDEDTKQKISENISKIKLENPKSYTCPFLINKVCAVYNYRGIVCRTFGLLSKDVEGAITIPFCAGLGLNYSKFWDNKEHNLSNELLKTVKSEVPPKAFNINLNRIMTIDLAKELNINFGEVKRLIDWL